MTVKSAGLVSLGLVVTLLSAGAFGMSGKAAVERELRRTEMRLHVETARANVLDGRLTLVGNDYARAQTLFAGAVDELETLQRMLRELSQAELAGKVEIVIANVKAARDQAGAQNANAWSSADAALQALKGIALPG